LGVLGGEIAGVRGGGFVWLLMGGCVGLSLGCG